MPVERHSAGTSLLDVLDRVLDKGIVIDAYVRVLLVGIDLIGLIQRPRHGCRRHARQSRDIFCI